MSFGFTWILEKGIEKPQCLVCHRILCHESMRKCKLKEHLEKKHPDLAKKPVEYFKKLESVAKRQRLDFGDKHTYDQRDAAKASLSVACEIAKAKEPHSIADKLIKRSALKMAEVMCGKEIADKLELVPLSAKTVKRRIEELAQNLLEQVIAGIKKSKCFAIQLDETTDVRNQAQLMVYCRYRGDEDFVEELLFCSPLETTTKGLDVFNMVDDFFRKQDVQLSWRDCVGVSTDGAPSMLGVHSGFVAHVKKVNPEILATHCVIHRQALAVKGLSDQLQNVMTDVVKLVNFIKASALNSRLFRSFCEEMNSEFQELLYYAETRWLSRGNVLQRVFKLRLEIEMFLIEKKHGLASKFSEKKWVCLLSYLVDIFGHLNDLNLSLQGREKTVIFLHEKIEGFKNKILLWSTKARDGKILSSFPTMAGYLEENDGILFEHVKETVCGHLNKLHERISDYFPAVDNSFYEWIPNLFLCQNLPDEPAGLAETILDIRSSTQLKLSFENASSVSSFWFSICSEFPIAFDCATKNSSTFRHNLSL